MSLGHRVGGRGFFLSAAPIVIVHGQRGGVRRAGAYGLFSGALRGAELPR